MVENGGKSNAVQAQIGHQRRLLHGRFQSPENGCFVICGDRPFNATSVKTRDHAFSFFKWICECAETKDPYLVQLRRKHGLDLRPEPLQMAAFSASRLVCPGDCLDSTSNTLRMSLLSELNPVESRSTAGWKFPSAKHGESSSPSRLTVWRPGSLGIFSAAPGAISYPMALSSLH